MTSPSPEDDLSLLIEIVSCRGLLMGDRTTSDPYVKVILGEITLHKTKHLLKTLNPVYSANENNIFCFNCKAKELKEGLVFQVKDWDRIGSNDDLGQALVPLSKLLRVQDTMEFQITPPKQRAKEDAGCIIINAKHADDSDRERHGAIMSGVTFWRPTHEVAEEPPKSPKKGLGSFAVGMVGKVAVAAKKTAGAVTKTTHKVVTAVGGSREPSLEEETHVQPQPGDRMKLIVEIMSCQNLLAGDKSGSSDPFVKVMMGKKQIHKTKHILKTLNPLFDEDSKSTFAMDCDAKDVFEAGGLIFHVLDWDRGIGGDDLLGAATVPAKDLYKSNWEPTDYKILPPKGEETEDAGYITIRSRSALDDEIKQKGIGLWNRGVVPVATKKEDENVVRSAPIHIPSEDKEILVVIKSCRKLLTGDKSGLSDPYVKIKLGGKKLHQTDHVVKSLSPVFHSRDRNFFILECGSKEELFKNGGLEFKIKDWNRVGRDDDLGSAFVPAESIFDASDEILEFKIEPPKGHAEVAGFISIHCRPATLGDKDDYKKSRGFLRNVSTVSDQKDEAVNAEAMADIEDKILQIEIVSCRDLLVADKTGVSDPYVMIILGDKVKHKTKHIRKTLNPVFTKETNNSYVLDCSAMKLYASNGLTIKAMDWDRGIGGDDDLGTVKIPADMWYNFGSEAREFKLDPPPGKSDTAGYVTIQCKEISTRERDSRKKGLFRALRPSSNNQDREIDFSDLSLLIEIVSCQKLIKADGNTSDPYIKVFLGDSEIHKTKVVHNTVDPIYTALTRSLLILKVVKQDFIESDCLVFQVKDYDTVSRNDVLGRVEVSGKTLCEANGERMVFKLEPPEEFKHLDAGFLNLRCRPVTPYDRKFLDFAAGKTEGVFLGVNKNNRIILTPRGGSNDFIKAKLSQIEKTGPDAGTKKYRIRPDPDPERPSITKWMSKEEIQAEAMKPSRKWIDIGSGRLGKVYIEIIAADGLPNMDTSLTGRDKTDSFAMIVYEDCCAKTAIIDDCLNPRWLPWMQRAFIFNIDHTSSDLLIGVFDYDCGIGGISDLIGRCPIELSSMRENTEYTLTFALYADAVHTDRKPRGTLTARVRVEYNNMRELVLSNLRPPPQEYINMKDKRDYKLVRQCIEGDSDLTSYSMSTLKLYLEELQTYLFLQYYFQDAIESLFLWRGQVLLFLGIKIPLFSMIAFFMAVTAAERPSLLFAYGWFSHAWILLAIQYWRNHLPHPWTKTRTYGQILRMLIFNRAMVGPEIIPENHKEKEAKLLEEKRKDRIIKAEEAVRKRHEEQMKILAEHEKEVAELKQEADTDIATKRGGISIDPLKSFLYPVQQQLAQVCAIVRIVKNIYIWDEPYFAFFLTTASLLIGIVFLFLPWSFLIRWTGRIVAWGVFGPHMKLVDLCYYSRLKEKTDEEEKEELSKYYLGLKKIAEENANLAFQQTEEAAKLKAVKKIIFGKWVARVPCIKNERFRDFPLHNSSAKKYEPTEDETQSTILRIHGQQLVGTMIPQLRAVKDFKDEQSRKAAKEEEDEREKGNGSDEEEQLPTEKTPLVAK